MTPPSADRSAASLRSLLDALARATPADRTGRAVFYVGERHADRAVVYVVTARGVCLLPRRRRARGSFDWPGPGRGADRLGRALLIDAGAVIPSRRLASAVQAEIVAWLDRQEFVLDADELREWIVTAGARRPLDGQAIDVLGLLTREWLRRGHPRLGW